ncbi:MAG TPA: DUF2892 domain-containing protein [Elusimicrobiales bacterium]|nr:DUF2892 domain-containing protein [Elusimicrobiales bacterium]
MVKNVGNTDKVLRYAAGAALAVGAYKSAGVLAVVLGAAAFMAFLTAILGWCGLYTLLGVSTVCKIEPPAAQPPAPDNEPE